MSGPFYNLIKGTTASGPGTGAFTPNAAAAGFRAWSNVPTGWWGLVRYEEGTDWELCYSYWNGTTLSRSATQDVASSTGSQLTLTAAATAALIADGARLQPRLIVAQRLAMPLLTATSFTAIGWASPTVTGTVGSATLATTNFLTEQPRTLSTSATTANAQAGFSYTVNYMVCSSAAGRGGWEFAARFGMTQLPTGQRLFVGGTSTSFIANTGEPSALVANYAVFGKDSTDTNIQLLTNSNAGTGTKIDTGIPLAANGWYECAIWSDPGSLTIKALLVRVDTGAIFYTETATDVPVNGAMLAPQMLTGLSATTGTAVILAFGGIAVRTGVW